MPQPMTDPDRANAITAIKTALEGVTSPTLAVVIPAPPWAISQDKECHFWSSGGEQTEEDSGLNDQSILSAFKVAVYWMAPANTAQMILQQNECWNAQVNIQAALMAHATLNSTVEAIDILPWTADLWVHASGSTYYALEIPIRLRCYGAFPVGS